MTEPQGNCDLILRIEQFLDANHVMALATNGEAGLHAANLFYARDGLSLIWVSDSGTRHSQDLINNPMVAATVAPDVSDYHAVRGVQIAGNAHLVNELGERDRLLSLLAKRYKFLASVENESDRMKSAFEKAGIYRLTPSRIVLIDNSRGFGHKEELLLAD